MPRYVLCKCWKLRHSMTYLATSCNPILAKTCPMGALDACPMVDESDNQVMRSGMRSRADKQPGTRW
jgi:hypothetical protein